MLSITDLKVGTTFVLDGDVYTVVSYEHSKVARGGAMLRTKVRNVFTGAVTDKTFKGSDKFDEARIERKNCQYLYRDDSEYFFMNTESYDQFSLSKDTIGKAADFIKEGDDVQIQYYKEKPITVVLPPKVKLTVSQSEKGLKGNSVSSSTKRVTLETGYTLQVPLFIKQGDTILVNTQTGEYVERI